MSVPGSKNIKKWTVCIIILYFESGKQNRSQRTQIQAEAGSTNENKFWRNELKYKCHSLKYGCIAAIMIFQDRPFSGFQHNISVTNTTIWHMMMSVTDWNVTNMQKNVTNILFSQHLEIVINITMSPTSLPPLRISNPSEPFTLVWSFFTSKVDKVYFGSISNPISRCSRFLDTSVNPKFCQT